MPSTDWRELVAPDEAERHAAAAGAIAAMQRRKNERFGVGRALHRKGLLCLPAELEVLAGLPDHARHGLLAQPGRYPALVRLSNGGTDVQSNRRPDIRGFAFRVSHLAPQPAALGGTITHQDFSLINQAAFAFATSAPFFGLVAAAAESPGALLRWIFRSYGLLGGLKRLRQMKATFGRPFPGFAAQTFHSTLPLSCGPYALKWRLSPVNGKPMAAGDSDFAADCLRQVQRGPLQYVLQAQFFESEARTPIETADQEWLEADAPFLTVGRLTLQAPPDDPAWHQRAEDGVFDPWQALAAHRPLGEVQRARKVVYFSSQQGRGAA